MAPLPKRRHSTRRQGKRTAAKLYKTQSLVKCPKCGNFTKSHRVCRICGYYKDVEVTKIKIKKDKKDKK